MSLPVSSTDRINDSLIQFFSIEGITHIAWTSIAKIMSVCNVPKPSALFDRLHMDNPGLARHEWKDGNTRYIDMCLLIDILRAWSNSISEAYCYRARAEAAIKEITDVCGIYPSSSKFVAEYKPKGAEPYYMCFIELPWESTANMLRLMMDHICCSEEVIRLNAIINSRPAAPFKKDADLIAMLKNNVGSVHVSDAGFRQMTDILLAKM